MDFDLPPEPQADLRDLDQFIADGNEGRGRSARRCCRVAHRRREDVARRRSRCARAGHLFGYMGAHKF